MKKLTWWGPDFLEPLADKDVAWLEEHERWHQKLRERAQEEKKLGRVQTADDP